MVGNYRDKEFISVAELGEILGISKTYAYEFLASNDCPFTAIKIGKKRIVIPTNAFYRWYDSLDK